MKKKCQSLLVIIIGLVMFSQTAYAHYDEAYSHAPGAVAENAAWMAQLDGSMRLSEISIPGTHDTMSVKGGDISQNQTMTLTEQLHSGIRVFDMRTRHINDSFAMHHGIIFQGTWFDNDVLVPINNFLDAYPGETVIMHLQSADTAVNNTRSYAETLQAYLDVYGAKYWAPTSNNPTLDEIRGKFVILQNFSGGDFGIPSGSLDAQGFLRSEWALTTNWNLYDKWTKVKAHIEKADNGSRDNVYFNFLSASTGSLPYFVASGHSSNGTSAARLATGLTTPGWAGSYPDFPRLNCFIGICTIAFEGTNILAADYIANSGIGFAGMVVADFPGKRLINNIINLNFPEKNCKTVYYEEVVGCDTITVSEEVCDDNI